MPDEQPPVTENPTTQEKQESAPIEKVSVAPAPIVEAGAKTPTDDPKKEVKGLKTDLFKARAKARDAEDSVSKINERLSSLEKTILESSRAKSGDWNTQTPNDEIGNDANGLEHRIVSKVESLLVRREAESRLVGAKVEANNWLLSREHLREDPNAVKEMADILEIPYYQELATKDPRAAARSAYVDWCEQRGIIPDIGKIHTESPTIGTQPTGGKKNEDNRIDVSSLKETKYGTKEYDARVKELEQAAREGKYKGKVIKL